MDTMSEDIEAAMEHLESGSEEPIAVSEVEASTDTTSTESVDPTFGQETVETSSNTSEIAGKTPISGETAPKADDPSGASQALKAPAGWTPKLRESWSKVPPEVQAQISAREKEMVESMANTSDARQTHDRMTQLGQSFAPIMAAEGINDPIQAAEGLFQTVAQLRMGSPAQKAKVIADLINSYGVDIGTLDDTIVGNTPQEAPNSDVERLIEQRMAPINQIMQLLTDQQAQKGEQTKAQAQQQIETFAQNAEFLGDVRHDMADLIDMAAKRGQTMPIEDAYAKACALNPEIAQVMEQRKITGGNTGLAAKRAAASSISGRKTGTGADKGMMSLRDTIADAWGESAHG